MNTFQNSISRPEEEKHAEKKEHLTEEKRSNSCDKIPGLAAFYSDPDSTTDDDSVPDLADQCDDSVPDLEDEHGDNQSRDWLSDKSLEIVYRALYYVIRFERLSFELMTLRNILGLSTRWFRCDAIYSELKLFFIHYETYNKYIHKKK